MVWLRLGRRASGCHRVEKQESPENGGGESWEEWDVRGSGGRAGKGANKAADTQWDRLSLWDRHPREQSDATNLTLLVTRCMGSAVTVPRNFKEDPDPSSHAKRVSCWELIGQHRQPGRASKTSPTPCTAGGHLNQHLNVGLPPDTFRVQLLHIPITHQQQP